MSKEIRPMNELCSQRRSNACSHRRERLKLPFFENRPPLLGWATVSEPAPGPAVARPAKKSAQERACALGSEKVAALAHSTGGFPQPFAISSLRCFLWRGFLRAHRSKKYLKENSSKYENICLSSLPVVLVDNLFEKGNSDARCLHCDSIVFKKHLLCVVLTRPFV